MANEPTQQKTLIGFRAPRHVVRIIESEAARRLCSVSDVARELVVCDLRRRGLLQDHPS